MRRGEGRGYKRGKGKGEFGGLGWVGLHWTALDSIELN